MAASRNIIWREYKFSNVCIIFIWTFLSLSRQGVDALKFLSPPPQVSSGFLARNIDFNCSTDDANATVKLFFAADFVNYNERTLSPEKLHLNKQVFTLLNLGVKDGGQYRCKATDGKENIEWPSTHGLLFLSQGKLPDIILDPPRPIIIQQGQTGKITCQALGWSVSKLAWKKRTNSGDQNVPDSKVTNVVDKSENLVKATLTFTNAQPQDSGEYKCVLTAFNRQDYKLANIRVDAPQPPTLYPYNGGTTVNEGTEKTLRCIAKASPKANITWYRHGKELQNTTSCSPSDEKECKTVYEIYEDDPTSALHTTFTKQVLQIHGAMYPRDQGEFKCIAMNGIGQPVELIIDLDILAPTAIDKERDEIPVKEGQESTVICKVTKSNPLPTFTWKYQTVKCEDCVPDESNWIDVPSYLLLTPQKQTNLSEVRVEKSQSAAFYRCQADNGVGNDTHIIKLIRLAKSKKIYEFESDSATQLDEEGTLHLVCIRRCGLWCTDTLFKDGQQLSVQKNDSRVNITTIQSSKDRYESRQILTIKKLTLNDSGSYRCGPAGPENDVLNITIKKLVAPDISKLPDKAAIQDEDFQVQLYCNATGHPKPTLTWYIERNGEKVRINEKGEGLGGNVDACEKRTSGYFFLVDRNPSDLVICRPKLQQIGKYTCRASSPRFKVKEQSAFINVFMAAKIKEPVDGYEIQKLKVGQKLNVTCRAEGNPLPNVSWVQNSTGKVIASDLGSLQLNKALEKDADFGSYKCIARNRLKNSGWRKDEVHIKVIKFSTPVTRAGGSPLSTGALVGIAIGVGVLVLLVLVICCVVYRRQKRQIDEYKEIYFLRSSDYQIDPDRSLLEQCSDLPYDPDWEFPEERLILGDVLGAGAFGQVIKAEAIGILAFEPRDKSAESFKRRSKIRRSSRAKDLKKEEGPGWKNTRIPVAVKTLKEGASESEYKDLASELKILIHLGQHKNIVNLLGACTRGKRLMVIMEFAPNGSLLSFLRGKRDIYEPDWTKTTNDPNKEFTLVDLVMISYQVSRGMAFLASRKCVHRDLAARNILVGEDYVMKIADFGLARDIYKDDLYVKKTQGLLPVKWMAPESLFDRVYTEKTDVWSFGILMWETFTLGGTPYPGLPTEQLLDYLSEGKRMDNPAKCPLEVYTVMRDCWLHDPEQRPHFATLNERLGKILERHMTTENPYLALELDDDEGVESQGYYLQPCDSGLRDSKRYVKSPISSPTGELPPNTTPEGAGMGYDSPLPALPPGLDVMSDDEIKNAPLPSIPPSYEEALSDEDESRPMRGGRTNSAAGESGIDVDGLDDGDYIDDIRGDTPFLSPVEKIPETDVLQKGNRRKIETAL